MSYESNDLYYYASDIQQMLGVSESKAYGIIKELNLKLKQADFIVLRGRVPKRYFQEHFYGF